MFKKIINKLSTTITGGAIIIAVFSILSKLVGLYRDRLLASRLGAGEFLDIYYASFRLPDLVFNTLILGALTAAFIPVFIKYLKKDKYEAELLSNAVLNLLLIIVGAISLIIIIFAPVIVPLIVPGFSEVNAELTARLTRIMFLSVIIFTFSNVLSGILNAYKRFFAFALAPVMYNIGIIIGILFLYPSKKFGIDGLAWGVVLGSFLHFFIQLIAVYRTGWRYVPIISFSHPGVKKIIKLMLPRTFALGANQINQLVMTIIASTLAVGSVAVFNLANNLQSLNVIGISFALSVFPVFSEAWADKNTNKLLNLFSFNTRRILFIMLPLSMLLFLLRAQVVRIILGAGLFDWQATINTAQTLGFFALSLFAQSLIPLFVRTFYAMEDTKTPVIISLLAVALNISLAFIFSDSLGVAGLALAFSLAAVFNLIVLLVWLKKRLVNLAIKPLLFSFTKIFFVSLASTGLAYLTLHFVGQIVNMRTFLGVFIQASAALGVGIVSYLIFSLSLNLDEAKIIKKYSGKIFKN